MRCMGAMPFIMVLALVFRFWGLNWDEGHFFHPDERNIISAAIELSYPEHIIPRFHAYNGLAIYLPRLLAELWALLSGTDTVSSTEIALAGRFFSALCSVVTVPILYRTAKNAGLNDEAWFAAFVVAFSPMAIQAAHFATTESVLVLVVTMLAWVSSEHQERTHKPILRSLLYGAILGVGLGFKTSVAAFGVIIFLAYAANAQRGAYLRNLLELCLAGVVSLALFTLTTPQLLFDTQAYFSTIAFEGKVVSGEADVFWTYQFYGKTSGLFEASQLPWVVGPLTAFLIFPGLLAFTFSLYKRNNNAQKLVPLVAASFIYAIIILSWHAKFIRYILLLLPCIALLATVMFSALMQKQRSTLAIALMCIGIFTPALRQAQLYLQKDPRITSWAWVAPQIAENDIVLVEPHDVGPPLSEPTTAPFKLEELPLTDPASPEKVTKIVSLLAEGNWIIISSRRNSQVLPDMRERFPELCGYYKLLFNGSFGYNTVRLTRRDALGLFQALDPSALAEETYSVFDAPTVLILKNIQRLPQQELTRKLEAASCLGKSKVN